jgi:probable HAF family extracellular repeat protein
LITALFTAFLWGGITAGPSVAETLTFEDMGYTLTDLGTLGGSHSVVDDFNERGQVVGRSTTAGDLALHAFLYSNGKMADLGTLGGYASFPVAINEKGQVVGVSVTAGDLYYHAFLYSDGKMTDLGTLGGNYSEPIVSTPMLLSMCNGARRTCT